MSRAPLIGVSGSVHDFGDYGGVGGHRPVLDAGGLPMALPQLVDAIGPALEREPRSSACAAAYRC